MKAPRRPSTLAPPIVSCFHDLLREIRLLCARPKIFRASVEHLRPGQGVPWVCVAVAPNVQATRLFYTSSIPVLQRPPQEAAL